MDSGYLTSGETLDDDYDVLRELLPEEVLGIMDQMLCFEVCSLSGLNQIDTILILIVGIVDGMAYGPPSIPVSLHIPLYRSFTMAGA